MDRRRTLGWLGAAALWAGASRLRAGEFGLASWTDEQKEQFLASAEIVRSRPIGEGVTDSERALLRDGETEHDAHIQWIDKGRGGADTLAGLRFRDSYIYNIAAYRLARLVGWRAVPVAVPRTVRGLPAAVSWWVDDVRFNESTRIAKRRFPPNRGEWNRQMYVLRVFDTWINNRDRNRGNLLITKQWRVRPIDHTRSFGTAAKLTNPEQLKRCDRVLLERLRSLDRLEIERAVGDVLSREEIEALLSRRAALVKHFDNLIGSYGKDKILYDWLTS